MNAIQCRMARAALGWSLRDLANYAEVGISTVRRFETGRGALTRANLHAMQRVMEAAGIEFTDGDTPGARVRHGPGADVPSAWCAA
jgi:transcriptional regulator with XRE-family HTH domain